MSRSKQLGGFPTSGVFGFRQTHTHAPQHQAGLHATDRSAGSSGVFSSGIGSDQHFIF